MKSVYVTRDQSDGYRYSFLGECSNALDVVVLMSMY